LSSNGLRWLRTDERLEAINSLQMVFEQLPKVKDDYHNWKWVLIALHNATQGFMVIALRKGTNFDVIRDHHTRRYYEFITGEREPIPIILMDYFLNLYTKVKDAALMQRWTNGQPFIPNGTHDASMARMNDERNDFIHFLPKGKSFGINLFPQMVQDCMDLIRFLSFDSGNIVWNEEEQEIQIQKLVEQIEAIVQPLIKEYEITEA